MPTHEFHSLFQKMSSIEKEQSWNEPIHLSIIGGVGISKNLILMF
jgi:hypothetical protein